MSVWQAIIFDLDDTLYPEHDFVLSGFRAVARWAEKRLAFPEEQVYVELEDLFRAGVRGNIFDHWLAAHGISSPGSIPDMVRVYREHRPVLKPFTGVAELLASLHRRYHLGIVSDGYLAVQQRKLESLNLSCYFDVVIFSDSLGRDAWKPSPKPFLAALETLKAASSRSVYIADNPLKDFWGAKQIGMRTIWCQESQGDYTRLQPPTDQHAADVTVASLSDVEQALTFLENK